MGRILVVVYKPFRGKEGDVLDVIGHHMPVLRAEGLATDRKPILMRSDDGSIIEIFEARSAEAIQQAAYNTKIQELWMAMGRISEFIKPTEVQEFQTLFSQFESIDFEEPN
jgi:hypothetical protein